MAYRLTKKVMDIHEKIDLLDCPCCGGAGLLEEERGWCWYVMCVDCGAQTTQFEFEDEAGRLRAAEQAASVWNMGKVVSSARGE